MSRPLAVPVLLAGALLAGTSAVHADPPGPPSPPGCRSCAGPPSPPTPVPTLGEATVPTERVVTVELSPLHVRRGGTTRAAVTASTDDRVTLVVHYHRGKPVTYRGTVGESGKLVKQWKVPKRTAVGRATVAVKVDGAGKPYSTVVKLLVTR